MAGMVGAKGMESRRLGRGDVAVSRFGLGTMTFGAETAQDEAFRMLDTFVDHGGTLIDTADVYGAGASEAFVGRWLSDRGRRDDVVIATKGRFAPPEGMAGASRRGLESAVEASLERLGVERIDVYFVHGWDPRTGVEETLDTLGDLIRAGKIRASAWSNLAGWQLRGILSTAEARGLPMPVALQPQYNLLDRGIELEVMPCCLEAGVSLTPWSPLGGGWLTGKYAADARPSGRTRLGEDPDRGVEAFDRRNTDRTHAILAALRSVADRCGRPPAHVALAWLAARPGVASILLGARDAAQLTDNLAALDLALDREAMDELTRASACGLPPYPYGFLQDWCGVDVWRRLGT